MAFNKVRYVTVCQQFLTTAVVLATGLTAAGVLTLDIVEPTPSTQVGESARGAHPESGADVTTARKPGTAARAEEKPAPADIRPVQPKVREVSVQTAPEASGKPAGDSARKAAPGKQADRKSDTAGDEQQPDEVSEGVPDGSRIVALSEPEDVTGFATVGVTWRGGAEIAEDDLRIEVRTEEGGKWSGWTEAEFHDDHAPNQGTGEARSKERPGTDALVIGDVDRVQMRATSPNGVAPDDVQLAIIDPGIGKQTEQKPAIDTASLKDGGSAAADSAGTTLPTSEGDVALSAMAVAPKPKIYSRAQWGANEKMRDGRPRYGTIKTGFVHHTVNANNYAANDVPALIRGIYAYHTQSRKWSDIGYNFLVDRFGRIWEGRYGGVDKAVIGAHTRGYNEVSFAMSAIGNFETVVPPKAVLSAYAELFAWKLSMYDIAADDTKVWVKNKYFQAINGHRDAGSTACPGRHLYYRLPVIRSEAKEIQDKGGTATPKPTWQPTMTPLATIEQPAGARFPGSHNLAGNGYPDLVTLDGAGNLRTWRTGGVTDFGAKKSIGPSWRTFTSINSVGDINRDGRPDFVNQVKNGLAVAYRSTANGNIERLGNTTSRFVGFGQITGVGDINGDRRPDVIARHNANGYIYAFNGNGAGVFSAPRLLTRGFARYGQQMFTVGQMLGNGLPDIGMVDANNTLWLVPATTRGRYGTPRKMPGVKGGTFLGVGDVDADNHTDLVWSKGRAIYAMPGRGDGTYSASAFGPVIIPGGITHPVMVQVAGSRHADVVGVSSGSPVVVAHNGRRNLHAPITGATGVPQASMILSVGDWNRDGRADIITRHHNGAQLVLRPGTGGGKFAKGITMPGNWSNISELTAVGDVTGDGMVDLAGRIGNYGMRIFPGNGRSGFWSVRWAPTRLVTFGQMGNGKWLPREMPDSVYTSADGRFVPIGGAVRSPAVRKRTVDPAVFDVVVGAGDLDRDGNSDLVVRQKSNGVLWFVKGNASGGSAARIYLGKGFAAYKAIG